MKANYLSSKVVMRSVFDYGDSPVFNHCGLHSSSLDLFLPPFDPGYKTNSGYLMSVSIFEEKFGKSVPKNRHTCFLSNVSPKKHLEMP